MTQTNSTDSKHHILTIGLVYDLPEKLERSQTLPFPASAEAEWETKETIERIAQGWRACGHTVIEFPLDRNFLVRWSREHANLDLVHSLVEAWGTPAREAWIPSLCELTGTPYIGTHPTGQCLAMRKSLFKTICLALGVSTPVFHVIRNNEDLARIPLSFLSQPHFIKPDCEGSGMGIDAESSISTSVESTRRVCTQMLEEFPDGILLEEYIDGIELTSAFLGSDVLPIAQIEVPGGVYGLANKSKDEMTERVTFPELPHDVVSDIHRTMDVLKCELGLEDFVRFDWKINERGVPMLLEANPLAGLSYYYSVLPKMALAAGISYDALLNRLAVSALDRKNDRRYWYGRARIQASKK